MAGTQRLRPKQTAAHFTAALATVPSSLQPDDHPAS